jgi:NAD+ kinase
VTSVGLVVHAGRPAAVEAAAELRGWLAERGVETCELPGGGPGEGDVGRVSATASHLDLIVSVGGDGTLLRAAAIAGESGCPVLGVKVGRMGFLTEAEPPEATALLARVLEGSARVEERLAVVARPEAGTLLDDQWALNEIMVEKSARHRLVRLRMTVDGTYVTTFSADGVIVATPTGSTAYSFSARGPIVTPSVPCLIVTPVAAHMVFDRSFVLAATQSVTLEVLGEVEAILSADGRESIELPVGARVRIGPAPTPVRFVVREDGPSFLERVRDKFRLPDDPDVTAEG